MEKETSGHVQALKAHLALNVKSVEQSIEFYRKMLGLEPVKVRRGYAKFDVQNPPLNLTLNEVPFKEGGALSHLGIQLGSTEDVLALRGTWIERGLTTHDEMQTNCCYAVQDKSWVYDPDGNQWEAFVVLEDNLAETTACCGTGETEQNAAASACSTSATGPAAATASEAASCCAPAAATPVAISSCCATSATTTTTAAV
ncbi:MAG TPA: ArsI/CadI family heavy metal resistance metalloenzyme [Pyrinomonadaceae bacterium]|nr:ArsI/CadI family heavy metal resistance metalloenzyme [Pyrinomonadaceae bacterium]